MDPDNNIPKKISFMDRLRFLFSGSNPVIDQMSARIEELEGQVETLKEQNADEIDKRKKAEAEKVIEDYRSEYERKRKEEQEGNKQEDAKAVDENEDKETVEEKVERAREDKGSIEKGDSEDISLKNYLREQLIREKLKLDESLAQMDVMGGSNKDKLKSIKKYQAKVLGILYAYTEYDYSSSPDVVKVFQDKIKDEATAMDADARKSFIDGYMHTRFQSCYYDDRDWEEYVDNPIFRGGEFRTPLTDGRLKNGYYAERKTFALISDSLAHMKVGHGEEKRADYTLSNIGEMVQTAKEVSGYEVKKVFEPKDNER